MVVPVQVVHVAMIREEPHEIYMIGHDLYSHNEKINNIYKSTRHYTQKKISPTPAINWINNGQSYLSCTKVKFIKINR